MAFSAKQIVCRTLNLNATHTQHVCVQVTPSFKALAQVNPDLAMNFVSEVAKKLGLPHKEVEDQTPQHASYAGMHAEGMKAGTSVPNLTDAASRMDVDTHRQALGHS